MTRTLCLSFSFVLRSGSAAIKDRRFTSFVQFAVHFFYHRTILFFSLLSRSPSHPSPSSSITFARGLLWSHEEFTHSLTDIGKALEKMKGTLITSVQTTPNTILHFQVSLDFCLFSV